MSTLRCVEELVEHIDDIIFERKGEFLSDNDVDEIVALFRAKEIELRVGCRRPKPPIGMINAIDVRTIERLFKERHKGARWI